MYFKELGSLKPEAVTHTMASGLASVTGRWLPMEAASSFVHLGQS